MIIEKELLELIQSKTINIAPIDIINECGFWYTKSQMFYELDYKNLEEILKDGFYWILNKNTFFFTQADSFEEDLDEYLGIEE